MVPLDELQKLVEGSYEQSVALVERAIKANHHLFIESGAGNNVSLLATFTDHAVVATTAGRYYEVSVKHMDGDAICEDVRELDVTVVDQSNAAEYVRDFTYSAVDALLGEDMELARDRVLALASLQEEKHDQVDGRSYAQEMYDHLGEDRPWRYIFSTQNAEIKRQVVDQLESIQESQFEAKYKPLYETDDISEERFEDYRDLVNGDLRVVAERLEKAQHAAETAYLPFAESVSDAEKTEEEDDVISHFQFFSEDLINDLQLTRELISEALQNEDCVMCLGQIYDALTESLASYEIAGAFVERMVQAFDETA